MVYMILSPAISSSFTEKLDNSPNLAVSLGISSFIASALLRQNSFLPKLFSLPVLFCASVINTSSLKNHPDPSRRNDAIIQSFALSLIVLYCTRPLNILLSTFAAFMASRLLASHFSLPHDSQLQGRRNECTDYPSVNFSGHNRTFFGESPSTIPSRGPYVRILDPATQVQSQPLNYLANGYSLRSNTRHVVGSDSPLIAETLRNREQPSASFRGFGITGRSSEPRFPQQSILQQSQFGAPESEYAFAQNTSDQIFAAPPTQGSQEDQAQQVNAGFGLFSANTSGISRTQSNERRIRNEKRHAVQSDPGSATSDECLGRALRNGAEVSCSVLNPWLNPGERHDVQSENSHIDLHGSNSEEAKLRFAQTNR